MEQQQPKMDFIEETKAMIADAPSDIQREFDKEVADGGDTHNWFSCFNTAATSVLGFFELAEKMQGLPQDKAELWKQQAKELKDAIQSKREESPEVAVEVSDVEERERLMKLLDIFREPEPQKK
jgi:hypothetical protein